MNNQCYSIGEPFPDKNYISDIDSVAIRTTQTSFDIIVTLCNSTPNERKAIICDKFTASLFVYKLATHIVLDFKEYKCNCAINIHKIAEERLSDWLNYHDTTICLYLLDASTGIIVNMRLIDFQLITQLRYLLSLQIPFTKAGVDKNIHEGEERFNIEDMILYSIYRFTIPESNINIFCQNSDYLF